MQKAFLLSILHKNLWMVWVRLLAFAERGRKTIIYKTLSLLFGSEKWGEKKKREKGKKSIICGISGL